MRDDILKQGVVHTVYRGKLDAQSPPPRIPDPRAPDPEAPNTPPLGDLEALRAEFADMLTKALVEIQ